MNRKKDRFLLHFCIFYSQKVGGIVGGIVAVVVVGIIVAVCCYCCVIKKRRQRAQAGRTIQKEKTQRELSALNL